MNYELLRPFDLEAAKAGAKITDKTEIEHTFAAEAGPDGDMAVRDPQGNVFVMDLSEARMVPLAWVEGKPVYPGDVLYRPGIVTGPLVVAGCARSGDEDFLYFEGNGGSVFADNRNLTWTPPKVKKEGWINVYSTSLASNARPRFVGNVHPTKSCADFDAGEDRIACVRIEWEE